MIGDRMQPAGLDNLRNRDAFTALLRPFPAALASTPKTLAFDPATTVFDVTYATTRPGGGRSRSGVLTEVVVPALRYPNSYTATARGESRLEAVRADAPASQPAERADRLGARTPGVTCR